MDDCNEDHRRHSRSDCKPKYSWRYFTPEDFLDHSDETEMDRLLSRGIVVPIRHVGETSAPPTNDREHSGNSPQWESHINMIPIEINHLQSANLDAGLYTNEVGSNPTQVDVDIVPYADEGDMSECRRDSFASGSYETDDLLSFMSDELAQGHLGRACLASPETDDGTASQGHSSASSGAEHLTYEGATLPRTSSLPSYDSAMYYPPLVCPTPSENTPEKVMNCKTPPESNISFS